MATFDDREKAFEKKFEHDEQLRFRAEMRRNKLVGLWAAGLMGMSGAEAEAYAKQVVEADLEEPGPEDVIRKVRADFDANGIEKSDHQIRRQLDECMAEAREQVMSETD
ncbi:MAG: DUF1476 domain-containing protein [Rhodospirillaceae bacterium]|nr:DUF1476 domain-containing protein [Rhodospirillaceae bacterium]MYB14592.1 DUF1476 domain-containing protein [Rhodospirillaceae bacterium]MYI47458.1 DUF1476 domain-containing protein [Rhodospirillaceae bacterium]